MEESEACLVKYLCFSVRPSEAEQPDTEVGEEQWELVSTVWDCCLVR